MPPADSSALIVARFLKSNHYTESYNAFIAEAGLPSNAGDVSKGDLTLETLLEEKKTFDLSVRFEKLGTGDGSTGWSEPAPNEEHALTSLPSRANLLSTSVEIFTIDGVPRSFLLATSADRRLHVLNTLTCSLRDSFSSLQDAPILSCAILNGKMLFTTSMSGQLVASDLSGRILDKRRDHAKYVVKVAIHAAQAGHGTLLATAGWDNKVNIYKPSLADTNTSITIGEPIATITLQTKPEAMLFLQHPDTSEPVLLLTRTDSNHIFYYTATTSPPVLLGKQNLAPHSNAWVAFTPSSLALCPTDPTLLAVGTNSVPHMKLLIVKLLVPPLQNTSSNTTSAVTSSPMAALLNPDQAPQTETQASQARAALAIADREAAAIQIHATTMAPQTPYSTPTVAWRPDGSGVWVNGDDGAVRGLEASTGKVIATLRGHEEGSKVRCLWAGFVEGAEGEKEEGARTEWLVSGGFDQKLIVWKVPGI